MKITIVAIGKLKEKFLVEGVAEYLKRLRLFSKIEIREIPECRTIDEEGKKILAQMPKDSFVFVLDVAGTAITSENFAKKISDFKMSLSEMTFTHQMARLILLEQIYRAFKINRGEPYHKI